MAFLQAIGTAVGVLGAIADMNSMAGQYKAESAFERRNAAILGGRSLQIGAEGARNEEQLRREARQQIGAQMAAAGEGAFNATGSAADSVRRSETLSELDALNIRHAAQSEARAYRNEAGAARMRSKLASKMAGRARLSGALRTVGIAAAGGASTYGAYKSGGGWGI